MTYHFIGLGGIGMSALARILMQKGERVQGSDIRPSQLLEALEKEGAAIQVGHMAEAVNSETTIVYSSDVKGDNVEIIRAKELKLPMLHRSDLLDRLMQGKKPLLVTGTHGKTTTSGLLANVLMEAGLDPSFVVGGILTGLQTNGRSGKGDYFVAEADESDGSFLKTPAFGAIVTNLENDHLEYWKEPKELDRAFDRFFSQVQGAEHLFWCVDDVRLSMLNPPGQSYGFSTKADWRIDRFRQTHNGIVFDLIHGLKTYSKIEVSLFGQHNALNAAAVFSLALSLQADEHLVRQGLRSFSGVLRRLEFKGEVQKVQVFDDYGHHPTEIAATLAALRGRIGERRLIAVFQPHRYTRVRDLFENFFSCFEDADEVVLTDIYGAGEPPLEGITSASFYMRMREKLGAKLHFLSRLNLETGVAKMLMPHDVVLTIGAGDITRIGEPILRHLAEISPKLTVALIFNETSLASAQILFQSLDPAIYEIKLFGVTEDGDWIQGSDSFEKIEHKTRLSSDSPKVSSQVLQELFKCQIAFPLFHGVQGLLDALRIPYAGSGYAETKFCRNKNWINYLADLCGSAAALTEGKSLDFIVRGNRAIRVCAPEDLEPVQSERGQELAKAIYCAAGCQVIAVVRLILGTDGHFRLKGIDPYPIDGWRSPLDRAELCDSLAISALHRQRAVS